LWGDTEEEVSMGGGGGDVGNEKRRALCEVDFDVKMRGCQRRQVLGHHPRDLDNRFLD
jgi:hypothetical protein